MKRIDKRQEEIAERLSEFEEQRELYNEKIGKSIQISDNLKSWEEKWRGKNISGMTSKSFGMMSLTTFLA
jgi:hypothetical protein